MKVSRIFLVGLAVLGAGALLWQSSAAQTAALPKSVPVRVAVLDVMEVLENYQRAKDLLDGLQKRKQQLDAEDVKRKENLDRIEAELDQLKKGAPEYEKRFNELQRLVIDREVWKKFQSAILLREHHALTRLLYEEIQQMAAQVAKEQSYQIVLYYERKMPESKSTPELGAILESRKVVYHDPSVDLTGTVLKRLNEAGRAATRP
jgi:Skp family chaperone for outer membrane proteins